MKFAVDKDAFIQLASGLQTLGPPQMRKQGSLEACLNYEPALNGGYQRTKGYERFSGKPSPTAATYQLLGVAMTAQPAFGTALVIGAATARVARMVTTSIMLVTSVVGTIAAADVITAAAVPIGTVSTLSPALSVPADLNLEFMGAAADVLRADIAVVPGFGPVRGVASFAGVVYAWRDDAAVATRCVMHAASAAGWVPLTFGEELSFTSANVNVNVGDVLTQGAATATVRAVVAKTGSLASGVNTGSIVISGRGATSFAVGAATSTGGGTLSLAGVQTAITLPPGGLYRSEVYNFGGAPAMERLYFVNGVGRASAFDGVTLVPIDTGDPTDKPALLAVHAERLILAIDSSIMWSAASTPLVFDGISGAQEFAMGYPVTGLAPLQGQTLAISTTQTVRALIGTPSAGMQLTTLSPTEGASMGAMVSTGDAFTLSQTGIQSFFTSQRYGSFEANNASDNFLPAAQEVQKSFAHAARVDLTGADNQIRFMSSTGLGLVCLVAGASANQPGRVVAATLIQYPVAPSCRFSGPIGAVLRLLFGAADGFVYEVGDSPSFDGAVIEAFIKTNPTNLKSPFTDKTFRDGFLTLETKQGSTLSAFIEFSSGSERRINSNTGAFSVGGAGGTWDASAWDTFNWDAGSEASPKLKIRGSGHNLAMTFYSNTRYDYGHTLYGVFVRYSLRKQTRTA